MAVKIKRIAAIKRYFGVEGHPITLQELAALTKQERTELAEGAAAAMGLELEAPQEQTA